MQKLNRKFECTITNKVTADSKKNIGAFVRVFGFDFVHHKNTYEHVSACLQKWNKKHTSYREIFKLSLRTDDVVEVITDRIQYFQYSKWRPRHLKRISEEIANKEVIFWC